MPLAGVAGFVALAAEHLGEGYNFVAERYVVVRDRRGLRIPPADKRRPRRRTNRCGGIKARGDRAVLCDPVNVRRADDLASVTAERLEVMLIRLDDEDIVRIGRRDRLAKRSQDQNRQQFFHRAKSCRLAKRLAMLWEFLVGIQIQWIRTDFQNASV